MKKYEMSELVKNFSPCEKCTDYDPRRFYMATTDSDICALCPKSDTIFSREYRKQQLVNFDKT